MNYAVILAGGVGSRMNSSVPKQFLHVMGKPLIIHTLLRFEKCNCIDKIIVVCLNGYEKLLKKQCLEYGISKLEHIVLGGKTRYESIFNALTFLEQKSVDFESQIIMHNANMPMITSDYITQLVEKKQKESGYDIIGSVAKNTSYLLEISDSENRLVLGPDRDNILLIKSPEILDFKTALSVFKSDKIGDKSYSSCNALLIGIMQGLNVGYMFCNSTNFKVTTEDDYELMTALLGK